MAKQDDYVRYTIRVPSDLYARVQEAAGEKSLNAEIVERLESSFEEIEGYKELSELFMETMKDNLARSQREVEEYRQLAHTISLMRHTIERFRDVVGEDLPDDLKTLLLMLNPDSTAKTMDPNKLIESLVSSWERLEEMTKEDRKGEEDRKKRILDLSERLKRRLDKPLKLT
ncbi:hypothetical protein [Tianweitania sp.]|uniref:hypothetical protein n=1 Tax=Tianweitania sp. TaxID=2021634 RepID=UPI0028A01319|nr:hypothetical protein [Tianweitania sp.]